MFFCINRCIVPLINYYQRVGRLIVFILTNKQLESNKLKKLFSLAQQRLNVNTC